MPNNFSRGLSSLMINGSLLGSLLIGNLCHAEASPSAEKGEGDNPVENSSLVSFPRSSTSLDGEFWPLLWFLGGVGMGLGGAWGVYQFSRSSRSPVLTKPCPSPEDCPPGCSELENRLVQIARHIPGVIYQFRMRPDGSFQFPYASEGIQAIYGLPAQQVQEDALPVLSVIHPEDQERVYQSVLESAQSLTPWHCEYRVCREEGRVLWVVGRATPQRERDGGTIWHGYITDISDRKATEIALQASQAKFATVFQMSPEPMWISLWATGCFLEVNQSFCEFLGLPREDIVGKTCQELCFWDDLASLTHLQQALTETGMIQNFEVVVRNTRQEPRTVLMSAKQALLNGQDCVIGMIKDIDERKQAENLLVQAKEEAEEAEAKLQKTQISLEKANQKLEKLVNLDALTHIANRRCFNHYLRQEWQRLYREKNCLSLILFDVDYFKAYNDHYGHPQGDSCLFQIAQTARKTIKRSTDLVARFGGEEFAVILPNTDHSGAIAVAEQLRLAVYHLNLEHQCANQGEIVTISLGVTTQIPSDQNTTQQLIAEADAALYSAKLQGRNRSISFREVEIED